MKNDEKQGGKVKNVEIEQENLNECAGI